MIDGTVGFLAVVFQSLTSAIKVAKSVPPKTSLSSHSVLFRTCAIAVIVQFCAAVKVRTSVLLRPVVAVFIVGFLNILLDSIVRLTHMLASVRYMIRKDRREFKDERERGRVCERSGHVVRVER